MDRKKNHRVPIGKTPSTSQQQTGEAAAVVGGYYNKFPAVGESVEDSFCWVLCGVEEEISRHYLDSFLMVVKRIFLLLW